MFSVIALRGAVLRRATLCGLVNSGVILFKISTSSGKNVIWFKLSPNDCMQKGITSKGNDIWKGLWIPSREFRESMNEWIKLNCLELRSFSFYEWELLNILKALCGRYNDLNQWTTRLLGRSKISSVDLHIFDKPLPDRLLYVPI